MWVDFFATRLEGERGRLRVVIDPDRNGTDPLFRIVAMGQCLEALHVSDGALVDFLLLPLKCRVIIERLR